jgi:N6-L-threonylcarbamoyladenine synthase
MLVLGIETSCDETAASVVKNGRIILSNIIASQVDFHKKFGGVVPEIASRKHLELINPVIEEALREAKITFEELDLIAVTCGPGLVGSLLIGLSTAKAIAYTCNLPLVGVDHLEGHIYSNFLEHPGLKFPFLSLIVSGGHTTLIYVKGQGKYELLGSTRDDAVGEAYDKVAKLLNLGYPGGPIIDNLAQKGNPQKINFPRAYLGKSLDFSFSGLKTAVLYYLRGSSQFDSRGRIPAGDFSLGGRSPQKTGLKDICASFQQAVVDVLVEKALRGAQKKKTERIVLGGGVAANTTLRRELKMRAEKEKIRVYFPSSLLCTDNAAMIACAGYYRSRIPAKKENFLSLDVFTNLALGGQT